MSQSNNSKDTQALLQSMLQKLKLQPGREGQPFPQSPPPVKVVSTPGHAKEKGFFNFQKKSPVNGIAADSKFGFKGGEKQQPSHGFVADGGPISVPSQKDNTDNGKVEKGALGQITGPEITPTDTRQLFPPKPVKDADITSSERTEKVTFGSSAVTSQVLNNEDAAPSMRQNPDQNQYCTSKFYAWSMKPADTAPEAGSEESKVLHVGNGGFEAPAESKDMLFVASSQNTPTSSLRRKQRSSENKTPRWTQKLKERWRDRQESFRKKGKQEGGSVAQKSEQAPEVSSAFILQLFSNL